MTELMHGAKLNKVEQRKPIKTWSEALRRKAR
jgi:hypothetical protein